MRPRKIRDLLIVIILGVIALELLLHMLMQLLPWAIAILVLGGIIRVFYHRKTF